MTENERAKLDRQFFRYLTIGAICAGLLLLLTIFVIGYGLIHYPPW